MKRLTYKLDEPVTSKYLHYEYMRIADYDIDKGNYGRITDDRIYNKLGKLEDFEEELGIDILTLFKAINEGIWLIDHLSLNEFDYFKRPRLYYSDGYKCYCFELALGGYVVKLEDYGKTWALTKEELKNVKKNR